MLSGKFVIRVQPKVHLDLKNEAAVNGESLNSLCVRKLSSAANKTPVESLSEIISTFQPLAVVLFGSVARGDNSAASDTDILIVLQSSQTLSRELYRKWDELNFATDLSPQFVTLPDLEKPIGSIWLENSVEGEILYDRTGAIKDILRKIRILIAEGRYVRKQSHGQSYWIRNEEK